MSESSLIISQALEIHDLKTKYKVMLKAINNIRDLLICIGGPLNDNVDGYTKPQLKIFFKISKLIDSAYDLDDCSTAGANAQDHGPGHPIHPDNQPS